MDSPCRSLGGALSQIASRAYHSIVRRNPSSNDTVASNPNSDLARLVSNLRRGWPLGFELSQEPRPFGQALAARDSAALGLSLDDDQADLAELTDSGEVLLVGNMLSGMKSMSKDGIMRVEILAALTTRLSAGQRSVRRASSAVLRAGRPATWQQQCGSRRSYDLPLQRA